MSGTVVVFDAAKQMKWDTPEPLPALPGVHAFNSALLPAPFQLLVDDIADRMQCPADYPAVALMIMASSIIGTQLRVKPKQLDSWMVVANLWGASIGRSGVMKTPPMSEAMHTLRKFEAEYSKAHAEDVAEFETQKVVRSEQTKINRTAIKTALESGDKDEAGRIATEETTGNDIPVRRRFKTNEPTVEKLGELLNENPNGILVERDELTGFFRNLEKTGRENDRSFYIECWNGDQGFTYDRIGRGTVDVTTACVSIFGNIQPGPLQAIVRGTGDNRSGDDGLIQRFQLAVWPDVSPDWKNIDVAPNREARNAVEMICRKLVNIDYAAIEAQKTDDNIWYLGFGLEAQELFTDWRIENEPRLRNGEFTPALESHLSKYRSLIPSIALICHLVDGGTGPITDKAMTMALAWAKYLQSHAERIYSAVSMPEISGASRILREIKKGKIDKRFAARDIQRKCWSELPDKESTHAAIQVLEDFGHIHSAQEPNAGRTATVYHVNPEVLK